MSSSGSQQNEFLELQNRLIRLGCYEPGMGLREMRHMMRTFIASGVYDEFVHNRLDLRPEVSRRNNPSLDSTITRGVADRSNRRSVDVKADVHHAIDWKPSARKLSRKSSASTGDLTDKSNQTYKLKISKSLPEGLNNLRNVINVQTDLTQIRRIRHSPREMEGVDLIESCETPASTSISCSSLTSHNASTTNPETMIPVSRVRISNESELDLLPTTSHSSGITESRSQSQNVSSPKRHKQKKSLLEKLYSKKKK